MQSCPVCSTFITPKLSESYYIKCPQCAHEMAIGFKQITTVPMPADWSFIQLKTTGIYKDIPFQIIGRVRLQLRHDYKNFWCAEHSRGKTLWIAESFNSFAVMDMPWQEHDGKPKNIRAGKNISVHGGVTGEYLEKCELLSIEGELGKWLNFVPGFFFVQASDLERTAFFTIVPQETVYITTGYKVTAQSLQLQNTIGWNEWA